MGSEFDHIQSTARFLKENFGEAPQVLVVLGSGLSPFVDILDSAKKIHTSGIPGVPASTVQGHAGILAIGSLKLEKGSSSRQVGILAGRVHGYEGHHPSRVVFLLRALRVWGVKKFILTNAAGSTSRNFKPGSMVLLRDHLNFTGQNPLIGTELFEGPRFQDVSNLYAKDWRKKIIKIARSLRIPLKEGVYAGVLGPNFETAAEIKMFARLGATMVGMSTVWEALALHQMGAVVAGLSCITNFGTGVSNSSLNHQEVIEETQKIQRQFNKLMGRLLYESAV